MSNVSPRLAFIVLPLTSISNNIAWLEGVRGWGLGIADFGFRIADCGFRIADVGLTIEVC